MRIHLLDLSSLAHPIWHMAGSDPNPNATSTQIIARVRALASGNPHFAICCDSGRSFRNDISADYKANRKPEERATLYHQIDLALDTLRGDGFPVWSATGFEADDVIASAAMRAAEDEYDVVILSADKDLLQLVCDREPGAGSIEVKSLKNGDVIDEAAVFARFGVRPEQMRDYLTIVGDVSDNVKGVAGIGEKGAASLLAEFGTLDAVYWALDTATKDQIKPSQVLALKAFAPRLAEVRALITLRTDAEIPFNEVLTPREAKNVAPMEEPMDQIDEAMPTLQAMPVLSEVETERAIDAAREAKAEVLRFHPAPIPSAPYSPAHNPPQAVYNPPSKALAVQTPDVLAPAPAEWREQLEPRSMQQAVVVANAAFKSRQFNAYGTAEAVLMTLLAGRELGLTAMASLRAIHIIEGKPTISADLMRALVLKSGAAKYFRCVERTNDKSTWETQREDDPPMRVAFTMDDAKQAGVVKPGSGWMKFPADMLVARASSKLARLVYPDILHGIYTPEELRENQ